MTHFRISNGERKFELWTVVENATFSTYTQHITHRRTGFFLKPFNYLLLYCSVSISTEILFYYSHKQCYSLLVFFFSLLLLLFNSFILIVQFHFLVLSNTHIAHSIKLYAFFIVFSRHIVLPVHTTGTLHRDVYKWK